MVRPRDREIAERLEAELLFSDQQMRPLPGIRDRARREVLIEQLIESMHRVRYATLLPEANISEQRADPNDALFDPLKAAVLHFRRGSADEAFWLVFLFVHFGKHSRGGWRYVREVYGRLGDGGRWDWSHTSGDPPEFRLWLRDHGKQIRRPGAPGGFGNHRKYQSLDGFSPMGTGATVESYVRWVNPPRSHMQLIDEALQAADGDRRDAFDLLYRSMSAVIGFGRTARFDYLTMLGKLGFGSIEPGSAYLQGATGPLTGAQLLFGERSSAKELDAYLQQLDINLDVGMQVLEDALCNWQKSPERFVRFRG